jgi:hypothetical protein
MADEGPSDEYREFVEALIPLDELQRRGAEARSPFDALRDRIAGRSEIGFNLSFFTGAGLLLLAAGLAAAMPSHVEGDFWRVGRDTVAELLAVGNGAAWPIFLGAVALVALGGLAALPNDELARGVLVAQPLIGGAGVAGVAILWAGFLAFVALNVLVLLLIIVAYVVATIVLCAMVIGIVIGMLSQ